VQETARRTIERIGYTKAEYYFEAKSCGVISAIHEQSADIAQGVDVGKSENDQGAGDQGMMFGYATDETDNYMPLALDLAHSILRELSAIRHEGKQMKYLRPDAKSQVTIEYTDKHVPKKIDTIVVSTQHDENVGQEQISRDIQKIVIPRVKKNLPKRLQRLFTADIQYYINPTGKFVIGGPHGDTGLTGRKIIVDTYGGKGAHGGGAFSGKDASKVDRSAAYATRHIAKNLVASGLCSQALVQVAYAIGVAKPVGLYVNTYGTCKIKGLSDGEIAQKLSAIFDLRPAAIVKRLRPEKSDLLRNGRLWPLRPGAAEENRTHRPQRQGGKTGGRDVYLGKTGRRGGYPKGISVELIVRAVLE
jgi:S-adenosylmethionine synthetase